MNNEFEKENINPFNPEFIRKKINNIEDNYKRDEFSNDLFTKSFYILFKYFVFLFLGLPTLFFIFGFFEYFTNLRSNFLAIPTYMLIVLIVFTYSQSKTPKISEELKNSRLELLNSLEKMTVVEDEKYFEILERIKYKNVDLFHSALENGISLEKIDQLFIEGIPRENIEDEILIIKQTELENFERPNILSKSAKKQNVSIMKNTKHSNMIVSTLILTIIVAMIASFLLKYPSTLQNKVTVEDEYFSKYFSVSSVEPEKEEWRGNPKVKDPIMATKYSFDKQKFYNDFKISENYFADTNTNSFSVPIISQEYSDNGLDFSGEKAYIDAKKVAWNIIYNQRQREKFNTLNKQNIQDILDIVKKVGNVTKLDITYSNPFYSSKCVTPSFDTKTMYEILYGYDYTGCESSELFLLFDMDSEFKKKDYFVKETILRNVKIEIKEYFKEKIPLNKQKVDLYLLSYLQ